jgi:acetyltransferase-like isoleucine patch superfamily enzyme
MKEIKFPNNSYIRANEIEIGKDFKLGSNVQINVRDLFKVGDYSRFGNDVSIEGQKVVIGDHFFHYTPGLVVGGGGSHYPEASLYVGDRCVFHNNNINICCPITIGSDVGLSLRVDFITHGFWQSALDGYPTQYKGIIIQDGVIIGQNTTILPGVLVEKDIVIGANSTVSKSLYEKGIYAGSPAKLIKEIKKLTHKEKISVANDIIDRYNYLCDYFSIKAKNFHYQYPIIQINKAELNIVNQTIKGEEDFDTDNLRDFLRRYGIRIYTSRPFGRLG